MSNNNPYLDEQLYQQGNAELAKSSGVLAHQHPRQAQSQNGNSSSQANNTEINIRQCQARTVDPSVWLPEQLALPPATFLSQCLQSLHSNSAVTNAADPSNSSMKLNREAAEFVPASQQSAPSQGQSNASNSSNAPNAANSQGASDVSQVFQMSNIPNIPPIPAQASNMPNMSSMGQMGQMGNMGNMANMSGMYGMQHQFGQMGLNGNNAQQSQQTQMNPDDGYFDAFDANAMEQGYIIGDDAHDPYEDQYGWDDPYDANGYDMGGGGYYGSYGAQGGYGNSSHYASGASGTYGQGGGYGFNNARQNVNNYAGSQHRRGGGVARGNRRGGGRPFQDFGKKAVDPKLGVLGIPFEYDPSLENPGPLTRDECFDLKSNQTMWTLDPSETHWTYNKFVRLDQQNECIVIKNTKGEEVEIDINNLPLILAQPSKTDGTQATHTLDPSSSSSSSGASGSVGPSSQSPTKLRGGMYDNIVGKFITINLADAGIATMRVLKYDKETSLAVLQEFEGDLRKLRLDQFEHEIKNISGGRVQPSGRELPIKQPTAEQLNQFQQQVRTTQTMSRQSSSGSKGSDDLGVDGSGRQKSEEAAVLPPLSNAQKVELENKEKIELMERKFVKNPFNLPLCGSDELKEAWKHGKLNDVLQEKMYWNHHKNSFLKALNVGSKDTRYTNLDYLNLMVVSGFGLSFYWPSFADVDELIDTDGGMKKSQDEAKEAEQMESVNTGNVNENGASAQGVVGMGENPNEKLFAEHQKVLMCDSQYSDILERVEKHSGYKLVAFNCQVACEPTKCDKGYDVVQTEKVIVRGLENSVATLTHDSLGHMALIVGYCQKPEHYKKQRNDGRFETNYFFKIKKMVSLKDDPMMDGDELHVNEIEYETIDLQHQQFIIVMFNPEAHQPAHLVDKMKMRLIRDALLEFVNQYRSGSKQVTSKISNEDVTVEVNDLTGAPAIEKILKQIDESIDESYDYLRKQSEVMGMDGVAGMGGINGIIQETSESDRSYDMLLGRMVIYALIRFYDSRTAMTQFFDRIYSLDPEIANVESGLFRKLGSIKDLLKSEINECERLDSRIFGEYVRKYDGTPLPSQIPEWTIKEKVQIKKLLNCVLKWEEEIMGDCTDIARIFSEHLLKRGQH